MLARVLSWLALQSGQRHWRYGVAELDLPQPVEPDADNDWLVHELLHTTITDSDSCAVVDLVGELDENTAPELRLQMRELLSFRPRVILDTSQLNFCGSSGLAVFVEAHQKAKVDQSELRIVVLPGSTLQRTLDLVGLTERCCRSFPIYKRHCIRLRSAMR
jgi:anti-sigma B factor antagonist